jgi:hypothetical protein
MRRSSIVLTAAIFSLTLAGSLFAQGNFAPGEPTPGRRYDNDRDYDGRRDNDGRWSDRRDGVENWRSDYRYGGRQHLTKLAEEVYSRANSVCWEMNNYYKHNRDFDATYKEAYKILQDAKNIRRRIADGYYRERHETDEIERDLKDLDKLFHHVEEDIAAWRPYNGPRRRQGDPLLVRMDRLEEALHDLMVDYGTDSRFRDRIGRRNDGHRWGHRQY